MSKEVTIRRNYVSDKAAMLRDIYTAICECFDTIQEDQERVELSKMLGCVMSKSKGHWDPKIIQSELERFKDE